MCRADGGFIGRDLGMADATVIIDGRMDVFPARTHGLTKAVIAGDTVTGALEPSRFLISRCNRSPGASWVYRCTAGAGSSADKRFKPARCNIRDTVLSETLSCWLIWR